MDASAHLIYGIKIHSEGDFDDTLPENSDELKDKIYELLDHAYVEGNLAVFSVGYTDGQATNFLGFRPVYADDFGTQLFAPSEVFNTQRTIEWYQKIMNFLQEHNLPYESSPEWHLCAAYG